MEAHPDTRMLDPGLSDAWAFALDCEDEDEEDGGSANFGSLMSLSLSVGKAKTKVTTKKKPVLEVDPEEAARALLEFEITAAQVLEGEGEKPAPAAAFVGLGPMDEGDLGEETDLGEEFGEDENATSFEDHGEAAPGREVEGLGGDVEGMAWLAGDAAEDGLEETGELEEFDEANLPSLSAMPLDLSKPIDLGAYDAGGYDTGEFDSPELESGELESGEFASSEFDYPPLAPTTDYQPDNSDLGADPESFEAESSEPFAAQWPEAGHELPGGLQSGGFQSVETHLDPITETGDLVALEELASPEEALAENEILVRMARPVAHSSLRAKLVRAPQARNNTMWHYFAAMMRRLYRLLARR